MEIAEGQHGLITFEQARHAGISPGGIRWRLRSGRWRRVQARVFAVTGSPATWEQSALAAVLAAGSGAVLSHGSAARLHGSTLGQLDEGIELTTERARHARLPGVVAHRSTLLFDEDRQRRARLPVTSPARLVVDLSGRLELAELGRFTDDLVRRRRLRLGALARCVGRLPVAPGRSPLKVQEVLRARWEGYDPGDSDLETRVLRAIAEAGLPIPRQQVRVSIRGHRYYLDLAYPELRLAIEIDSWNYHRWRSRFDGDRVKRNDLTLLGWTVIQVTDGMTDEEIVVTIAAALNVLGQKLGA